MLGARRSSLVLAALAAIAGCSSTETASPGAAPTDASSEGRMCLGAASFSEPCLTMLRAMCLSHSSEAECTADTRLSPSAQCTWARVLRFSDVASCTVEAELYRCEAAWVGSGEGPPCSWIGFGPTSELEWASPSPLCGPIGPWQDPNYDRYDVISCESRLPPAPEVCKCVGVADAGTFPDARSDRQIVYPPLDASIPPPAEGGSNCDQGPTPHVVSIARGADADPNCPMLAASDFGNRYTCSFTEHDCWVKLECLIDGVFVHA